MPNYKDINNQVHFIESVEYEHVLPSGCIQITQAEADALRAPNSSQLALEKAAMLSYARAARETVLNRLTGIQLNTTDAQTISAIQAARLSLLDITNDAGVVAAVDGQSTKAAVLSAYRRIADSLTAAAPTVANVFTGIGEVVR